MQLRQFRVQIRNGSVAGADGAIFMDRIVVVGTIGTIPAAGVVCCDWIMLSDYGLGMQIVCFCVRFELTFSATTGCFSVQTEQYFCFV